MATFQTSTLVDGAWVTRDMDPMTVLQYHQQLDNDKNTSKEISGAPEYGILTRTVVQSPIFHWVLPIRLRGISENGVAFIGVRHSAPSFLCHASQSMLLRADTSERTVADMHRTLCVS